MYFPLFIDLSEKEILVIGAGHIASRRVHLLCGFAGHITIVAPQIADDFAAPDTDTKITMVKRCFTESDLDGVDLVLAATDDRHLNRKVFDLCHTRGIPVNVCSDSGLCDFQFPSIVENGAVVIGINASGRDHRLVKETRKQVESLFPDPQFKSKYK
ncbi:MAG: bifunctional precorrin-2 dehydrogenase/sirohydrochlorin ferrochelatase [Clostridiales bacterium]|nr:bifunctional precorrin-2 dehydrogenase/sirohydrochlorin ferrochelatase [Clostridiales bacterium]